MFNILNKVDFSWESRKIKDKIIKENVLNTIKVLTMTLVDENNLKVRKLEENEFKQHKFLAENMNIKEEKAKYIGKFYEYYVLGETELDVYLNILKKVANKNSVRYPMC